MDSAQTWQEPVALAIVAMVALNMGWRIFRAFFGKSMGKWLLRRGYVRLAMKFFHQK